MSAAVGSDREPMDRAKQPVGVGVAPLVGQLIALALIAIGVVAVQETLVRTSLISAGSWTSATVSWADDRGRAWWMLPAFVLLALAGLVLLLALLRPRPRKALTLVAGTGVYLRTGDLARLVQTRLEGADGVVEISSAASRGALRVQATTISRERDDAALEADLRERVAPVLAALRHPPRVSVTVRHEDLT